MDALVDRMFRRIDQARGRGADMAAHMPTLYALARLQSHGPVVECGVARGFSTHALLAGVVEGGGGLTSYELEPSYGSLAFANMGLAPGATEAGRWRFVAKHSVDAALEWPDGTVTLLFIDTSHELEETRRELAAWLPKMHRTGLVVGHDYLLHLDPEWGHTGVKRAVDEFTAANAARFRLQVMPYDQGLFILWPRQEWLTA